MTQYPPARLFRPSSGDAGSAMAVVVHDVIAALRPRVVVDLGAGRRSTWLTLCQAMEENGVAGACFAVDEWTDAQEWASVRQDAARRGGPHARLIRADPASAAAEFAEGSVGILHLGTAPDEDAFAAWVSRIEPGGVILVEGILPGSGSAEARTFWQKLRRDFAQCFELPAGEGVGMVQIGQGASTGTFVDGFFGPESEFLTHYYVLLTELATLRNAARTEDTTLARQNESLRLELRQAHAERIAVAAEFRGLHARVASLTEQLARQEERLQEEQQHAAAQLLAIEEERASDRKLAQEELKRIADRWSEARSEADRLRAESDRLVSELAARGNTVDAAPASTVPVGVWEQERQQLQAAIEDRKRAVTELKNSLSWRVTAPLRAVAGILSGQTGKPE